MSTEHNTAEDDGVNLDDFAAELFGQSKAAPEPASSKEEEEVDDSKIDAPEDTHEADTLDSENDDDDGEDGEPNKEADEAKPKKNRFQERIDEVVAKQREAEREVAELRRKLEEASRPKEPKPEPKPQAQVKDDTSPKPTDTNEDGTEKYPLGEFDPNYMRDFMRHTLNEETRIREAAAQERSQQEAADAQQAALQTEWNNKLTPAKERYPDFDEKGQNMLSVFENIEPAYGEYLTNAIMDLEYGPDVFYYLANNVDEAKTIVAAGARKATAMLGRIEAQFVDAGEKSEPVIKTTKAPPPPEHLNRGSAVAKPAIRGDEDDINLDDFAKELFGKRR